MAMKELDAIYEHGVFRPTDPGSLDLVDGQKVRLVVESLEIDPAVEREMAAYIAMHPMLLEKYAGQYVAIYGDELIDHDEEMARLLARIEKQHPHEFVWLTKVEPEAIPTYTYRSPRISRIKSA
jgi:predicted DNA-binding antitoxin AbrB/MazE fold protein